MENALDKLDDLEYELEKAYEWLDDHKGDKRKSCSSRKKVCMLQKACERLRDAYEDEFEEESSDEDDDGWVCMESLVHQVGIPKMEEKETKKEADQKSLEEPLDNPILPLECAHGVEEEYPLLKITPILSNERMEIGIWREDLNSQESKKGTPHNLILTPTTIDAIDVSCLYEEDFSKEHAIFFHKAHEMLIYPLISYGVLLEAILCDGMCISIHTMNYWKHDGACLPIHATTLHLNHARIMMSNFAQRLDGKIWFYLIDYHDGITQWFFLLLCLEGNSLWYFILKVFLKDDDGFLWMAQCIVKMDVFEACYVKANDFLEGEAYARHGDVCNMKLKIMEDVPTLKMAVEEGSISGLRILFSGSALSQTGGHGDFRLPSEDQLCGCSCSRSSVNLGRVCDGVPEVRKAARDELRKGASQLKIMVSGGVASPTDYVKNLQFSAEEISAVVEEAKNVGAYVCAHAYTAASVKRALELGVRSIEHGNFVDNQCLDLMKSNGAFLVPTLVTYDCICRHGEFAGMPKAIVNKVADLLECGIQALALAEDKGVNICFGTDLLGTMHDYQLEEFKLRSKVLSAASILRSATSICVKLLCLEGKVGVIAVGAYSDLLVLEKNPLTDIHSMFDPDNITMILKEGEIVNSKTLILRVLDTGCM
ncbi:hypothetical protein L7F22_006353 [Adiantum nelumboides]|nr:hypothetical protein [Adiantum nelumboides]